MAKVPKFDSDQWSEELRVALSGFLDRVREDRNVLAVVRVGSFDPQIVWRKDAIALWIIEIDGVSRRLKSDGQDERIFRTFVEDGINFHAELIPRARFKQMVEGSSRTAFSCNFFDKRELVYCEDASIENWFDKANSVATRDQDKERMIATTWVLESARYARKRIERKQDLELGFEAILWAVHSIAAVEVINQGEVHESDSLYRAIELQPELFQAIYLDLLSRKKTKKNLLKALDTIDAYVEASAEAAFEPLLEFFRKQPGHTIPLSHLCEHFAHSQIYPWHLESACEWMERARRLEKLAMPFQITRKSRVDVEEPAYLFDPD